MSEFSESYHLRDVNIDEGVDLLRRSGLMGYVFPSINNWVSIVAEKNSFAPDRRIVSQNKGLLLHYVSAEDHGWSFALFEGKKLVSAYDCNWDDEVHINDSRYSFEPLARIFGKNSKKRILAIEHIFHPKNIDEAIDTEPSVVFAKAMKLPHFEWFAYDYVAHDYHEHPEEYAGVIKVARK